MAATPSSQCYDSYACIASTLAYSEAMRKRDREPITPANSEARCILGATCLTSCKHVITNVVEAAKYQQPQGRVEPEILVCPGLSNGRNFLGRQILRTCQAVTLPQGDPAVADITDVMIRDGARVYRDSDVYTDGRHAKPIV